jgi:hypothetical protein
MQPEDMIHSDSIPLEVELPERNNAIKRRD